MLEEDQCALDSESRAESMLPAPFVASHIINDRVNETAMTIN